MQRVEGLAGEVRGAYLVHPRQGLERERAVVASADVVCDLLDVGDAPRAARDLLLPGRVGGREPNTRVARSEHGARAAQDVGHAAGVPDIRLAERVVMVQDDLPIRARGVHKVDQDAEVFRVREA